MNKKVLIPFIIMFLTIIIIVPIKAQIDVKGKIKNKTINRADQKTDEGIDKGLDKVEDGVKNLFKKKEKKDKESKTDQDTEIEENNSDDSQLDKSKTDNVQDDRQFTTYKKYEFISGDQVLYFEDFSQDILGEYPAKWNTDGGGEVVTIDKYPGNWFKPNLEAVHLPEITLKLAENYTLEFDFIYSYKENSNCFYFDLYEKIEGEGINELVPGVGGFSISLNQDWVGNSNWKDQNYGTNWNQFSTTHLENNNNKIIRVSLWVQKQRVRLWLDQEKVFDVVRLIPEGLKINTFRINLHSCEMPDYNAYITNIRIAQSTPDIRSKLITEGKLTVNGIYFDSGSDKIKPESYPVLKEISKVLTDNPTVKVKIIGHTDSDGDDVKNLTLSQKRAAAVKNSLSAEFGIDASRMETDGKGEKEPISLNNTSEGKANNRRVEFIKL
ncbi:MAG: OmpA family protein [Bacteroidales bacterium]|nr:OmpA family protein [Bacteroidales bacterium]